MSPLAYQFPNDKNTWGIKDQLLFGEFIMVGLVTEYKDRTKEMYFPKGQWYNYWTNEKIEGGREITVKASLNETPMFVKAGSILPIGPKVQYATQKSTEPIQIKVYPGKDATFVLYLDDSESYEYESGKYSEIVFTYSEKNKTIQLEKGIDNYIGFKNVPMKFVVSMVGYEKNEVVVFNGMEKVVSF